MNNNQKDVRLPILRPYASLLFFSDCISLYVRPNVPAIVRLYQLSDQRQRSEGLSRFLSCFRDKNVLKHVLNNVSIYMSFETLHCTT